MKIGLLKPPNSTPGPFPSVKGGHLSWRRFTSQCALVAVVASALALALVDSAFATFSPSASYSLSTAAANAPSDGTFSYSVPGGDELSNHIAVRPPAEAAIAPGPGGGGFSPGTHPALGDIIADVQRTWFVGLVGGFCNSALNLTFRPMNATVNNTAGNLIYPSLSGEADSGGTMSPLINDTYTVSPGAGSAGPGSATSGPANGLPSIVDRYPSYLNTIFDTDNGPGVAPLAPLARYAAGQIVAGSATVLDIVVFEPGATAAFTPPHPLAGIPDGFDQGYSIVVIFNGQAPLPATITSQCTPESYAISFYGEGRVNPCNGNTAPPCNSTSNINNPTVGVTTGVDRYRNPVVTGTRQWRTWARSVAGSEANLSQGLAITAGTTSVDSDGDGIHDGIDGSWQGGTTFWNRSMIGSPTFTDQHFSGGTTFGQVISSSTPATWTISDDATGVRITYTGPSGSMTVSMCGGAFEVTVGPGDDVILTCSSLTTAVVTGTVTVKFGTITAMLPAGTTSTVTDLGSGDYQVANSGGSSTTISVGGLTVNPNQTIVVRDTDGDGTVDQVDLDDDNDGVSDAAETACGSDPLDVTPPLSRPERIDGPFLGVDDDGDTIVDEALPRGGANFDCDGDGYVGNTETGTSLCGNAINDDNAAVPPDDALVNDGCPAVGVPETDCADTATTGLPLDDDGDGANNDGCPQGGTYSEAQFNISTNDQDACGTNGWPADLVSTSPSANKITLTDLSSFVATPRHLGTSPGDAGFNVRWDLVPGPVTVTGKFIVLTDLSNITTLFPPMLGSVRAFNGPVCPWPP